MVTEDKRAHSEKTIPCVAPRHTLRIKENKALVMWKPEVNEISTDLQIQVRASTSHHMKDSAVISQPHIARVGRYIQIDTVCLFSEGGLNGHRRASSHTIGYCVKPS